MSALKDQRTKMTELLTNNEQVLADLRALAEAQDTGWRVSDVARERADGIEHSQAYLENQHHSVALVGEIGIGKSAMITVLSRLLVGDAPSDKTTLRENSVLALGAGGTTVCEVRIRAKSSTDPHSHGLIIEPFSIEEMRNEIRLFAQDEWTRRHSSTKAKRDDDQDPTPREVQRVIREMTNLALHQTTVTEKGQKRRTTVDPLDDVVKKHGSAESLTNDLVARAALLTRTESEWWWEKKSESLQAMKRRFHEVNHGRAPTAMLPRKITLIVPKPLPGLRKDLEVEIIDTRGFDGRLAGRRDIQDVLRDPRTLVVLCTPFKAAPGEAVKMLLGDIKADAALRSAADRILLMLLDHGDGEAVNGADGDRVFGQDLKLRECETSLSGAGLSMFAGRERLGAFDAIRDDRKSVVQLVEARIDAMRALEERRLVQQVDDAKSFLENLENERISLARAEVDRRLSTTFEANAPEGAPLRDPLEGLYAAIRDCRYASQVYAACRRGGNYWALDAYASVRSGASRAATDWLAKFDAIMDGALNALELDVELTDATEHVRLRRAQYEHGRVEAVDGYSESVGSNVEVALSPAQALWAACESEWGRGVGFKERVVKNLAQWSRSQNSLHAHEQAELTGLLPANVDPSERE
jgi:hypothetical protein